MTQSSAGTLAGDRVRVHPGLQSPPPIGASVTSKVVRVLQAFDRGQPLLSMSELARRAGLPKTTTHRIVSELVQGGLLERSESGIQLSVKLFELGHLAADLRALRHAALPVLEDLHRALGTTVHLAMLDGSDAFYVEIRGTSAEMRLPTQVGGRMPTYCTAIGKAMLAHAPRETVAAVLRGKMPRRTPFTISQPGALLRQLDRIRSSGFAVDQQEAQLGLVCVSSVVSPPDGTSGAAISASGNVRRLDIARAVPVVRDAATKIATRWREHLDSPTW